MMLYTKPVQAAVQSIKVPHDFVMDVVEFSSYPPFIALRFYESHWRYMSDAERGRCAEYLLKVKAVIESYGINVTIDPVMDVKIN